MGCGLRVMGCGLRVAGYGKPGSVSICVLFVNKPPNVNNLTEIDVFFSVKIILQQHLHCQDLSDALRVVNRSI
jgi:hypothetical protein